MARQLRPPTGKPQRRLLAFDLMRLLIATFAVVSLSAQTPVFTYQIVHTYPHDRTAFTEGLEYHD